MINVYSIFRHFSNSVKRHMRQLILRQKKNFNSSKGRILSVVANHLVTKKTRTLRKKQKKTRVVLRSDGRELALSGARSSCAQFELFLRVPGLRNYTESGKQSS